MKTSKQQETHSLTALLLVCTSFLIGSAAVAQINPKTNVQTADKAKTTDKKKEEPDQKTGTSDKKTDTNKQVTAIVGGDIYTVTNEVIRRGTVLIQDGKILNVGQDIDVPEGAKVIDAKGKIITPGFISMTTRGVGLAGTPSRGQKFSDQLNPFDNNIKISLGVGITTACLQVTNSSSSSRRRAENELFVGLDPEINRLEKTAIDFNIDFGDPNTALCECCGLPILATDTIERPTPEPIRPQVNAVIKLSAGRLDGMMVSESVFYHLTPGALTGALNQHTWRANIRKAKDYLKALEEHEKAKAKDPKAKAPKKPVSDELLALVQKKIALRISSDNVSAIRDNIELAKQQDYKVVIDGATEGWVVPDELAEAGISVIITPRRRRSPRFALEDVTGSNIESSKVYESAGVPFGIVPLSSSISLNGLAGRDLTSLPLEAAFAVRGGCSEKTALEALTIVPAKMLGLQDRIGSIETGKDADILILNGQPLDYRTYVETAIVNGHVAYERAADKVYPVYER
ncbi:MAG: amidohydrolase family protein [Fuerstiella sp.]